MIKRSVRWLAERPHVTGALLALAIAMGVYGRDIEAYVVPVLDDVTVFDVTRDGDRIEWQTSFCKLRQLRFDRVEFFLTYNDGSTVFTLDGVRGRGIGGRVVNSVRSTLPEGCFTTHFFTLLPPAADGGGQIVGTVWYYAAHPLWRLPQGFGEINVPPR